MDKITEKKASASIWQVAKAVMFAFMGIRRKSDLESDAAAITPAQVVIGGLIGGAIFVISILLLVKWVVS